MWVLTVISKHEKNNDTCKEYNHFELLGFPTVRKKLEFFQFVHKIVACSGNDQEVVLCTPPTQGMAEHKNRCTNSAVNLSIRSSWDDWRAAWKRYTLQYFILQETVFENNQVNDSWIFFFVPIIRLNGKDGRSKLESILKLYSAFLDFLKIHF